MVGWLAHSGSEPFNCPFPKTFSLVHTSCLGYIIILSELHQVENGLLMAISLNRTLISEMVTQEVEVENVFHTTVGPP